MHLRPLILATILPALLLTSAPAQEAPPQDTPTLRLGSNLVFVPAQVQTKKGEMIYGLTPQQFTLEDNGVPQKFRVDEDTDARGLSLVVVVQCSREAFAQFNRMKGLDAMVDDLTGGAPRQVAVVSYGSEPELIGDFTPDPDKLNHNLAQLEPCEDGGNVTLDAVAFANKLFDQDPKTSALTQTRRAILLIGETRDHGSKVKPETVIADLGRSNTVVDSVSFNPGKTTIIDSLIHGQFGPGPFGLLVMAVEAVRRNVPHTLASLTGGEYTNFSTQKGFDAGIHKLANHIHNYYLLSFQPVGPAGAPLTPGLHRLTVKVPDYPDAQIRSRLTYYAGEAPPPEVPDKPEKEKK
ncbi:VWA domain-containing protein [Granulicella tundricola]|uniref:VWFA-related domain protein n=1 Tax=Granulicella tundricola (strain ATCC BAA-1859 / DSM 23138 / MP5ACTX9) TaxID=1198114 RepID=E8WVT4_GRATM|nr:VWA domain-containing protein [Granulicella tundricola]ADW70693.1 VWFA-related domain protein [Granulicella tundricola MP5ACTX9]